MSYLIVSRQSDAEKVQRAPLNVASCSAAVQLPRCFRGVSPDDAIRPHECRVAFKAVDASTSSPAQEIRKVRAPERRCPRLRTSIDHQYNGPCVRRGYGDTSTCRL